jgi:Flp pilus assembly protein TadB
MPIRTRNRVGGATFITLLAKGTKMSVLTILLVIVVVGVLLWLVNTYIPMQPTVKSILNAVVIILLVLWLLSAFGVIDVLQGTRVGS